MDQAIWRWKQTKAKKVDWNVRCFKDNKDKVNENSQFVARWRDTAAGTRSNVFGHQRKVITAS